MKNEKWKENPIISGGRVFLVALLWVMLTAAGAQAFTLNVVDGNGNALCWAWYCGW